MRLTKAQVTGLFEFPRNELSLMKTLTNELKVKKRGGTKKRKSKKKRDTRKNKY